MINDDENIFMGLEAICISLSSLLRGFPVFPAGGYNFDKTYWAFLKCHHPQETDILLLLIIFKWGSFLKVVDYDFLWAVLGLQKNWVQSAEFQYTPSYPSSQLPLLTYAYMWHICYNWWANIDILLLPKVSILRFTLYAVHSMGFWQMYGISTIIVSFRMSVLP